MDQDPTAARWLFTTVTPDRDPPLNNSRDPLLHFLEDACYKLNFVNKLHLTNLFE
jgi:hypothetical protein